MTTNISVKTAAEHGRRLRGATPEALVALAFAALFYEAGTTLLRDWWHDPEAGHGLLLGPLAVWLAWRRGLRPNSEAQPFLGIVILALAVSLRYAAGLAAELFTLRFSMLLAGGGLVIFYAGWRQLAHWWLPAALLALSVPLPATVLNSLALPLQLEASQLGVALLELRHVPVGLAGNVIHLPDQALFVTEACSGLRSLTALTALGVLVGGLFLRTWVGRGVLVLLVIPVGIAVNGGRVFLTGFLSFFVSPDLATGFMHYSQGWAMFVVALIILAAVASLVARAEGIVARLRDRRGLGAAPPEVPA